jgi:hypothetical protein
MELDEDLEVELPSGTKVKVNLSIFEWLIICITIAFVAYVKFS